MAVKETYAFSKVLRDSLIAQAAQSEFLQLDQLTGSLPTPDNCIPLQNPRQPVVELVSPLAVFNDSDSEKVVRIHRLCVNDVSPFYQSSAAAPITNVYRITALTGGEDAVVVKHDSNNSDLPSQVVAKFAIGEVTVTGNPLRKSIVPTMQVTGSMLGRTAGVGGNKNDSLSMSSLYSLHDSVPQTIVLREGEGICLRAINDGASSIPYGTGISEVCVEFAIGSEVYTASAGMMPYANQDLFALFNGSGSGVVINVGAIKFTNLHGSVINNVNWNVMTISAIRGGDDFQIQPMDSANALLPDASVKIRNNAVVAIAGPDQFLFPAKRGFGDQIRVRGGGCAHGFISNGGGFVGRIGADFNGYSDVIRDVPPMSSKDPSAISEMVVRPGEGWALIPICTTGAVNRFADWEVHAIVSVEDISVPEPPAPTSGGGSYMRRR